MTWATWPLLHVKACRYVLVPRANMASHISHTVRVTKHRVLDKSIHTPSSLLPCYSSSGDVYMQKAANGYLDSNFLRSCYSPESKQKSRGSCLMAREWKETWLWGPVGEPGWPMLGTPCSVYLGSMSSCLNPCGGTATSGSDICRWYGGRLLLLLPAACVKNWGRLWLSDGGQGRHGSDICRWNLQMKWKKKPKPYNSLYFPKRCCQRHKMKNSPVLRCKVVGIPVDGRKGHGKGRALVVNWERFLAWRYGACC